MSPLDRLRDRSDNDPVFHTVVTMLEGVLQDARLTPSEVREAAMFACLRIEERRLPTLVLEGDDIRYATLEEEARLREGRR